MSEWKVVHVHENKTEAPNFLTLHVPAVAGNYQYTIGLPAGYHGTTYEFVHRHYYHSLINSPYYKSTPCKDIFAAYKRALTEEDEANQKKYNMTKDQYLHFLRTNGYSTDGVNKVPKPNMDHCSYAHHNDDGEHVIYQVTQTYSHHHPYHSSGCCHGGPYHTYFR
ncbi:hypothetical protein GGI07_000778 [Coemansia sp. Benny D115]|nr:hypothetical protein GGI07_000778 [Coemansia sp. Benny D115]